MGIIYADEHVITSLGRQGESGVTEIVFRTDSWEEEYGTGTYVLMNKRPGDKEAYPCVTTAGDGKVRWTVMEQDTTKFGQGECQLTLYVDGKIKKSVRYYTVIYPSVGQTGDEDEPYAPWVNEVIRAAAEAKDAAEDAQDASEAVQNMSADAVTTDPGSEATVEKEVDPETGAVTLHFGIPAGLVEFLRFEYDAQTGQIIAVYPKDSSDYVFYYNEATGELEVEIA